MKILKLPLMVLCITAFSNLALADNSLEAFKVTSFTGPYNSNFDLKMDSQEQVAYLSTITQESNGDQRMHLWSMKEDAEKPDTHDTAISDDLLQGLMITKQNPNKLHLAIHYDQSNNVSSQYISYIDQNQKNLLVIWQRYPCTPNGNYCLRKLSETMPIGSLSTFDIAVQKDGNLLVATVDNTSHVHLYKYVTQFYGTAPAPTILIGEDSKLIIPQTANYGQFKLTLVGTNQNPYVVFPSSGSDSEHGKIATSFVLDWNQNSDPKRWSDANATDFNGNSVAINANSQIDVLASATDNSFQVAFMMTGTGSFNQITLASFNANNNSWANFHNMSEDHVVYKRPILATDGSTIYTLYAREYYGEHQYTTANIFSVNDPKNMYFGDNSEVAPQYANHTIQYTGLVMYPKSTRYYKGFAIVQDPGSNDLVIKVLASKNPQ